MASIWCRNELFRMSLFSLVYSQLLSVHDFQACFYNANQSGCRFAFTNWLMRFYYVDSKYLVRTCYNAQ